MTDHSPPATPGNILAVLDELERLLNLDEKGDALALIQSTRGKLLASATPDSRTDQDAYGGRCEPVESALLNLRTLAMSLNHAAESSIEMTPDYITGTASLLLREVNMLEQSIEEEVAIEVAGARRDSSRAIVLSRLIAPGGAA